MTRLKKLMPRLFILRKSQMSLFDTHHVAYTRTNASGTVSQIQAKGAPRSNFDPHHKPITRREKPAPRAPKSETDYRIVRNDDEGGTGFIIYDKDMRIVEIPNEAGETEAYWPKMLDASRALNRHMGSEHKLSKVAKGEYDAIKKSHSGLYLLRKSKGHDVSNEQRDPHSGKWIKEVADFKERLLDHKAAMLNPRQPVSLMQNTPDIYLQLGAQDRPIEITVDAIDKILASPFKRSDGHELPVDVAKELPKALHNPIMVFKPDPEPVAGKKRPEWAQNSFVVITEIEHKDKPLIVILQMDIQAGGRTNLVHRISSSYEKPEAKIKDWINKGLLLMADKNKGLDWLRSRRLYRHVDGTSLQAQTPSHTILFKSIGVNYIVEKTESLRSGLWLLRNPCITTLSAEIETASHGGEQIASGGSEIILEKSLASTAELLEGLGTSNTGGTSVDIAFHNTLQKSELPTEGRKAAKLYDAPMLLRKSRKLDGRIEFNGLDISIETGRSRVREWYNPHDGSQGMSRMSM